MPIEDFDTQAWELPKASEGSIVDQIEDHLPNPFAIRAVALTLVSVVAAAIGRQIDIAPVLDAILSAYTIGVPFVLSAWLGRKAQKANKAAASSTSP